MKRDSQFWAGYWAQKRDPLGRPEAFNEACSQELRLLFAAAQPGKVLEIGCGNGAMYRQLGFDRTSYRGVDFSQPMVQSFLDKYPDADVILGRGDIYKDDRTYDLIFCNQVVQYFDRSMLSNFMKNARRMVHSKSTVVCAGVPWKSHRRRYFTGALWHPPQPTLRGFLLATAAAWGYRDSMGYWYDFAEVGRIAESNDFRPEFFGCFHFPYRFHAVLTPVG